MRKKLCSLLLAVLLLTACFVSYTSTVYAKTALAITKQPVSVTVQSGSTAKVSFSVAGDGLTYKWYYKNAGDTKFTRTTAFKGRAYSVEMSKSRNGRQVYCVVTDKYGKSLKTNTATLRMGTTLKITKQPVSVVAPSGSTAKVSFTATGDGLKYKWYYKNAGASKFTVTTSFTGRSYSAEMNKSRSGRQVYCVVTDKYGNSVKTDVVTLSMGTPLKITKQPVSAVATNGSVAEVSFTAAGDGLKYKWYYKNAGASKFTTTSTFTGRSYSAEMNKSRSGRQVYCVVTDKHGNSVKTNTVTLYMGTPLTITKQPTPAVATNGSTAKVSFSVAGDGLKYKWYYKNAGASKFTATSTFTGRSYSAEMNKSRTGRQVYCQITDKYGVSVKTNTVTLYMGNPLKITKQPKSADACNGVDVKVTLTAAGDGLKYKWYYKDEGSSKFTYTSTFSGNTYTTTMTNRRDGRQIYCVVTDKYGLSATTDIATLTVSHAYDTGVITREPTCKKAGEKVYTCRKCSRKVTEELPKTSHKLGDWKVVREATVTTEGVERRTCANCTYYQDRSLAKLPAVYYITANVGADKPIKVGVAANGKYTLADPTRLGYIFTGWQTADGAAFSKQGTIKKNITITAQWELEGTDTLAELVERTDAGVDRIVITGDITLNQPIFISYKTTIFADEDHTILRAPGYAGDLFVVGRDRQNNSASVLQRQAVLTLGGGKGMLTIDGNRDKLTTTVVGSAVFLSDSSVLNLYDGVRIANNKKLGNQRIFNFLNVSGQWTHEKAGGAAVLNLRSTINMYGGILENNLVATEHTVVTNDDGTTSSNETNGCGGAIYNRGNLNMYGGTITTSEALRGGGIYTDHVTYLFAGTVSNNLAHAYGGGLASSSNGTADIYVGAEGTDADKMVFSGNHCKGTGGAMYSNTSSPIIILGNAVFENNTSDSSGGAIYTAGPLTARNARFVGNSCVSSGGAIYHHYTKAEFQRRELTLENCVFENNKGNLGGAVILSSTGTAAAAGNGTIATITGCEFKGNQAVMKDTSTGSGGAIYITKNSVATIKDCSFTKNSSTGNAGAVATQGGTNVTLTASTFTENTALQGGGLYTSTAASLQLTDLTFTGNSATTNANGGAGLGGAMFIDRTPVTTKNIDLLNNTAGGHGGAVYMRAITLNVDADWQISGNRAAQHGGAFYLTYLTNSDNTKTGAVLNATNTTFEGNSAMGGGAVSVRSECAFNMDGVKLLNNSVSGYVDSKNDGEGEGGGAIYVGYGELTLNNVTATGNSASDFGGVVDATGSTVTVTGGTYTGNTTNSGGVIYARNGSTVTVTDATLNDNESTYVQGETYDSNIGGGAINVVSGTLDVKNTTLDGNKAGYYGGAILANKSTVTIGENSVVSNSVGATGAALYFKGGSVVTIKDIRVTNNTSNGNGVVYQNAGTLEMTNVSATGNKANQGGVLFTSGADTQVTVKDCTWSDNAATSNGGALFMENASVTVLDCEMKNNTAKNGGAVYNRKGVLVTTDTPYSGNSATAGSGGAICMGGGTVNVTGDSQFVGNTATSHAGAIYASYFSNEDKTKFPGVLTANGAIFDGNTAMGGGAVSIRTDCEATLENTTLTGNSVTGNDGKADGSGEGGGAVYVGYGALTLTNVTATGNTSSTYGGAVQALESSVTIKNGTYTENEAATAGAIYVSPASTATIEDVTFTDNAATANGGALYVNRADLTASNLDFTGNEAGTNGGAIYMTGIELDVDSQWTFSENKAGGHGGAIYVVYATDATTNTRIGAVLNATDVTFDGNTAMAGGAISARSACIVNLNGTKLVNNGVEGYVDDGKEETTTDNDGDGEGGGAIYVGYGTVNMTNVTATGNTASDFGGVVDAMASTVTITGGTYSGNEANNGGVIHAMSGSTVTITGATLKDNKAPYANTEYNTAIGGGAIHTVGGKLNISGTTLDGNSSANYAGTIHASNTTVKIDGNSVLTNSTGATGAGLYFKSGSKVTLENISVINNNSSSNGVIYQTGGTLTMNNVSATDNQAASGGVLYTSGDAQVTLSNSTWSDNTATSSGGTIYAKGATINLVNSTLKENTAKYGGAVSVYDGGTLNLTGMTFRNNTATADGGAIFNKGGNVIGADTADSVNVFTGNTASGNGGAIDVVIYTNETTQATKGGTLTLTGGTYTDNKGKTGGVIAAYTGSVVTIQGATFHSNEATTGGAVYLTEGSVADLANLTFTENSSTANGGALYVYGVDITASNLDFAKNTAGGHGGALYLCATELTLDAASTFTENTAGSHGGAVYLTYKTNEDKTRTGAVLNATGVAFDGNTALGGGAISVRSASIANLDGVKLTNNSVTGYADKNDGDGEGGGAIYVGYGTLNMTNVTATGNTASDFGGVVDAVASTVTITDGTFSGNAANNGGVIHAMTDSTVTFTGATLKDNESLYVQGETYDATKGGGAIHAVSGNLILTDTILDGNKTGYYGGAIHTNKTTVIIDGGSILNSQGATGAACYFAYNSVVTVTDTTVTDNVATGNGVLYILGTMTMDNVTATGNKAYAGGVLYASAAATQATVKNSTFSGNTATEGGAIYLKVDATVNLENSTMKENTAKYGGVAYVYDGATLNLSGTTFQNNSATADGGAIYIKAANVNGTDTEGSTNTFTGNTAVNHGGAIYVNYIKGEEGKANTPGVLNMTGGLFESNSSMGGGAVSIRSSCNGTFDGTTFTNNSVSGFAGTNDGDGEGGGAIYVGYGELTLNNVTATGNAASDFGGVVDATGSTVTITGGTFTGNTANSGGVIYALNNSKVTVTGATMSENESVYVQGETPNSNMGGGAIYANGGTLTVKSTTFDGNKTGYYGGAISANKATVIISDNSVITASTGATGAALYFRGGSKVTITDTSVTDNTSSGSGVIYQNGGTLDMTNVTATGNTANSGGVLLISGNTTGTLKESSWSGNHANYGGAIYMENATVTISDSELKENTSILGGAIYNKLGTLTMDGVTFADNAATKDSGGSNGNGGAIVLNGGTMTATGDNAFTGNTAENHAGAIYVTYVNNEDGSKTGGVLNMTGGLFEGNTALAGGAISSRTAGEVYLTGTVLRGNTATAVQKDSAGGGAIYSNDGTLTLSGVTLENNTTAYYGGALYTVNSVVTATDNCQIKGNTGVTGTALWFTIKANTTITLTDMVLENNARTTGNSNGTLYATGSGKLVITNLTGTDNTSTNGGIMYTSGGLTITMDKSTLTGNTALNVGGVIAYRGSGSLTITDTTMKNNTAANGGAIEASGSGKVIVKNSKLDENAATKSGGAIYATGTAKVEISDNTTVNTNTAPTGGAIFADTGASVTVNNSTFDGNTATGGDGGAIVVADTTKTDTDPVGPAATTLTMTGVTLQNNTASSKGGALATDTNSPNLVINVTDCTFLGNKALGAGGGAVEIQHGNQTTATDPTAVTIVFTGCTFTGNTAKTTGGAIEIRTSSTAKVDGITATDNTGTNGAAIYVTSNYSRLYLTGTVTQSGNTAKESSGATFIGLYNNKYSNPPMIYTTHASTADWYADVGGNRTSVTFDMTTMP